MLAEISPINLRGTIGSVHQLLVTISILIAQILGLPALLGNENLWPLIFGKLSETKCAQIMVGFICSIRRCSVRPSAYSLADVPRIAEAQHYQQAEERASENRPRKTSNAKRHRTNVCERKCGRTSGARAHQRRGDGGSRSAAHNDGRIVPRPTSSKQKPTNFQRTYDEITVCTLHRSHDDAQSATFRHKRRHVLLDSHLPRRRFTRQLAVLRDNSDGRH